jgi:hypothetical protein
VSHVAQDALSRIRRRERPHEPERPGDPSLREAAEEYARPLKPWARAIVLATPTPPALS